jgi:hypothetical protein
MTIELPWAAILAFAGVVLGYFIRPWVDDRFAREREARVARKEREAQRRKRLGEIAKILADGPGPLSASKQDAWNKLTSLAQATRDNGLIALIGVLNSTPEGTQSWTEALGNAKRYVGDRMGELDVG